MHTSGFVDQIWGALVQENDLCVCEGGYFANSSPAQQHFQQVKAAGVTRETR